MHGPLMGVGPFGPTLGIGVLVFVFIVLIWEIFWKGLALWHAARNSQWVWFIVFLFLHTAGILEIVYLVFFRENRENEHMLPWYSSRGKTIVKVVEKVSADTPSDSSSAA